MKRTILVCVIIASLALASSVSAHHSFAATYRENQSVTIEGIVVGDYEGPCPSGTQPPDTACALRGFYVQSPDGL